MFTEAKLDGLLSYLARRIEESPPGMEKCVLLTDQAVVLYLWESLARGKECGISFFDRSNLASRSRILGGARQYERSQALEFPWPHLSQRDD